MSAAERIKGFRSEKPTAILPRQFYVLIFRKMLPVSVVIPAYNASKFIGDAIASVLAQTCPAAEIIVVDDGSTDDIEGGIGEYSRSVKLVRQRNAGPAEARNRGLNAAAQPWIAFLDADDYWLPTKLADQFAVLDAQPSVAMIASDMAEIDAEGHVLIPSMLAHRGMLRRFSAFGSRPIPTALNLLLTANFIPTGTVVARKSAILSAGGFPANIRYGEDLALWARLAAAHDIVCLPIVHMHRRRHDTNVTSAGSPLYGDVARVVDDITTWGHSILKAAGQSPARFRSTAWCDYGYSLFREGRYAQSRRAFWRSLSARLNGRAMRYLAFTLLPSRLLDWLRAGRAG